MIGFLKSLFGSRPQVTKPTPNSMDIGSVWIEFSEIVRPPGQAKFIDLLQKPENAKALSWLQPPTNCPMAKSLLRVLVDVHRNGHWDSLTTVDFVYRSDGVDPIKPPDSSIEGIRCMCVLLQASAKILWQADPKENTWGKIELTLEP